MSSGADPTDPASNPATDPATDLATNLATDLLDPAAYPHRPASVEHLQTHISHLFFAGDRVYKVKKPVDLGFLDFTSLAARQHFCAEEVRLNRRLAGDVYHGVVPIRRQPDRAIRVGAGPGTVIDYAVEMQRLPADRMLDHLIDAGDMDNARMRDLAELLANFHATAATGAGVDEHGSLETVRRNCVENFDQTIPFTSPPAVLSRRLHGFLRRRTLTFLEDHAELFEARVRGGHIREGHGDLHAANICVLPERIVVYDCIEFSRRFRCGDVVEDLAFLLMDMDRRRFRSFGQYLLREYVHRSGDEQARLLVDFYKGYRAFVRGKVTAMGLSDLEDAAREHARAVAMEYFHLAAAYELPPALVLCCGLPGSGKSFVADHLARPFEAVILNSDLTRKRLAGIPPTEHRDAGFEHGLYTPERSDRTYAELLHLAEDHLAQHRTVILDAGFRSRARREPFLALAERLAVPSVVVHVDAPEPVVLARLERRPGMRGTSDAGVEVYRAMRGSFEPPTEPAATAIAYDGESPVIDVTARLIDQLVGCVPRRRSRRNG